jgi:hypothetical protein
MAKSAQFAFKIEIETCSGHFYLLSKMIPKIQYRNSSFFLKNASQLLKHSQSFWVITRG